jgi:hypothetical protein
MRDTRLQLVVVRIPCCPTVSRRWRGPNRSARVLRRGPTLQGLRCVPERPSCVHAQRLQAKHKAAEETC